MPRRVAVVGPGPAWRRGVAGILGDAGFDTIEIDVLDAWRPGRGGVAVAYRCSGDDGLDRISEFSSDHPHIPVVAIMPEIGPGEYAAAIRAGAATAVTEDGATDEYSLAFNAALADLSTIPVPIMRAIASRLRPGVGEGWLTENDIGRLRALAAGATVADLAEHAGYSEREMFRLLKTLYGALGVDGRTQAIVWAARHGLLDDPAD